MPSPRVAIIGAGPAGCALGIILSQGSVPYMIFEADASPESRNQGGSLDLHEEMGIKTLRACGLEDQFLKHARYDGEAMLGLSLDMKVWLQIQACTAETSHGRPEIDRSALRDILINRQPPGSIQWNRRVQSVHDDDGKKTIEFVDGTTETGFDVIVGAEGAWSKTRRLLTSQLPFYSGCAGYTGQITNAESRYPELTKLVNHGSTFAGGNGTFLGAQWTGEGTLYVFNMSRRPEDYENTCGYDVHDRVAAKHALVQDFGKIDDQLLAFLDAMDDDSIIWRKMYMQPIDITWEHRAGVTVIGDAAHLMTMFAGVGVNLALLDALELGNAIVSGKESLEAVDKNVEAFEKAMFARSKIYAKLTYDNMCDMILADDAATPAAVKRFAQRMQDQPGAFDFVDGAEK